MNQDILAQFGDIKQVSVLMDGVCRIQIQNGQMQQDQLPKDYIPKVMQLFFNNELVHESFPKEKRVSVNRLTQ